MKVLVLNAGSSSIKYALFELPVENALMSGLIEKIGESSSRHRYQRADGFSQTDETALANHQQGLSLLFNTLIASGLLASVAELACIGHRVVHGGELFSAPARIDDAVLKQIEAMIPLAPLHNPANLLGIQEAMAQVGQAVPQVAVFDTAFHQTMPDYAYRYAVPKAWYQDYAVRRYGFHGTSHYYVTKRAAAQLGRPLAELNLITLHLGNGASVAAIKNGQCVDTSMGLTPLEGLIMGTRSGDLDPAIPFYMQRVAGLSAAQTENTLNKQSGCKGLCGENDMRAIHALADGGDNDAQLTLAMVSYRIKKYLGSYLAVLGRADAIVFTGGIGENDAALRAHCCEGLEGVGIALNSPLNAEPARGERAVHAAGSAVAVWVIPTNEELEIAVQAVSVVQC